MSEAVAAPSPEPAESLSLFEKFSNAFSTLFPLWTALVAILGVYVPSSFSWIPTSAFTALLGILMLSMGITLSLDDFRRVAQKPGVMGVGFAGCYIFMPLLALGLSRVLNLSPALTAGMVLVGSINGGQASNLCTYIARGDVALSVMMTTVTTIGAIVMTPLISKILLGALVPVDALGVAISTIAGVLSTCVLVGSAVAQCSAPILAA